MKFQAVKGTYDIFPSNQAKDVYENQSTWQHLYSVVETVGLNNPPTDKQTKNLFPLPSSLFPLEL
ncbi:MAG: hypothetical protein ACRCYY_20985 [Trueperaceae bacterium]